MAGFYPEALRHVRGCLKSQRQRHCEGDSPKQTMPFRHAELDSASPPVEIAGQARNDDARQIAGQARNDDAWWIDVALLGEASFASSCGGVVVLAPRPPLQVGEGEGVRAGSSLSNLERAGGEELRGKTCAAKDASLSDLMLKGVPVGLAELPATTAPAADMRRLPTSMGCFRLCRKATLCRYRCFAVWHWLL